jgi:RNA recognition motif-containing protein
MSVRLFVGGLAFTTSTEGLRDAFARFGPVQSAAVMTDRETGRSRGFGFVEMATEQEAERAISALNGSSLDGRMIRVDKATPRGAGGPPRPRPAGGFAPRGDRPAGGGFAPRPPGGGFGGPRPGGGPRVGAGGWTPPAPEGRGGNRRGDRRSGPPGPGGDGRPKKSGGRKNLTPNDRRGGRGRLGSDGDYRWGR